MREQDTLFGFKVISCTALADLNATLYRMVHEKTGAELVWLDRKDENKTFCIAFKTVPFDDTGVFHILEHSVLCGSEAYPVREPFVELLKGSLNTFLNAMTFPDKTAYPVSSRSEADFENLMRVYLDAVFFPNIYRNPNIFRQEGWHYELDENGKPKRVGVVYGEMKGAFSSVDQQIFTKVHSMLYPDTCYGFVSGGDPACIPDLTYEAFLDAHRRFYHPSNAKIILDGSVQIEKALKLIGETYLDRFARRESDFAIKEQPMIPSTEKTLRYEIAHNEDKTGKAHFALGKVVGSWRDAKKTLALQVLLDALTGSNSAPIKRAVLERGLGQDMIAMLNDGIAQPGLLLMVKNCDDKLLPRMKDTLLAIFREVLKNGLDRDELTASLNRLEFQSRERSEPFGVGLSFRMLNSWLYGGEPTLHLALSGTFDELRDALNGSYYADLFKEVFLHDEGFAALSMLPSETVGKERAEADRKKLDVIAASWTDADREMILKEQRELAAWQQGTDTPEQLATIPHLKKNDLSEEPQWTDFTRETRGNIEIIRPAIQANGTVYLNLYFSLPHTDREKLSSLSLLAGLLGELSTKRHDRAGLSREIKTWLGTLDFAIVPIGTLNDPDCATCYLRVGCSVLERNVPYAVSLIREVLNETDFNQPAIFDEVLKQSAMMAERSLIMSGHQYAAQRALKGFTAEGAAKNALFGHGLNQYLKAAVECFDFEGTKAYFESVMASLKDRALTVGVTGRIEEADLAALLDGFGGTKAESTLTLKTVSASETAIPIPADVAYAVAAGNFARSERYRGFFVLAAKILSLNYLWNEVRVQGGAYGSGMAVRPNGDVFCYSDRDPNPARSLGVYRAASNYLRAFSERKEPFDQLLIGTVSDDEPLLAPMMESQTVLEQALKGVTREQKRVWRKELLTADYADLCAFADLLERISEQESVCTVGGEPLLDACGEKAKNRI